MPTLRQQIGQMLIMGFEGAELTATHPLRQCFAEDSLGGLIFFDRPLHDKSASKNLIHRQQIKRLIQEINSLQCPKSLPLFMAIDYEGGQVNRLRSIEGCMETLPPREWIDFSEEALVQYVDNMAITLKDLGFNLNFAPVLDLDLVSDAGVIGALGRSFSSNPSLVVHYALAMVKAFSQQGIVSCYKHFPGHGSARKDSHLDAVDVTQTFLQDELEPYRLLIEKPALKSMIMTAHVINRQLDEKGLPATLSYPILTGLLRNKLGFKGIIISDDMQMQAISHHYSFEESIELTINAGADMMIFGNQWGVVTATKVIDTIENLVHSNRVSATRIMQSYQRIADLKQSLSCSVRDVRMA